jgi:NAD(P)-dependent dehydrogenase (short-subunit alcohol dehydrogenase family)
MNIAGKVALVTGGASGLGAASVRRIIAAGGRAVVIDVNREAGDELATQWKASVRFIQADVSSPRDMEAAITSGVTAFGGLDILINCAGIGDARRILGKDGPVNLEWFTRVIQVNLIGTFNAIRLAAAAMAKNQPGPDGERGVIISTASAAAFDGQIGQAAYSASKGGIVGMTLPLARDLARHGIRVVTVAPGLFDTPLLAKLPEPARQALAAAVPFPPRLGRPEEFAMLAQQIIENPMLNGEVIRLDAALRMAPQ